MAAAVKSLKDQGWTQSEVRRFIENLDIQLTLTAHPTEVKRYTVRLKLERISSALRRLGEHALSPQAKEQLKEEIFAEISTLWQTRELFSQKPTVIDEVKSALYYYNRSLLKAVPRLMLDMESSLEDYYGKSKTDAPLAPVVKFRSWIGGDRDGNPFVTPDITKEAYRLQSEVAMEAHLADVDLMVQRLSQWENRITLTHSFRNDLEAFIEAQGLPKRFPEEPYRQKLIFMHRALKAEEAEPLPTDAAMPDTGYPDNASGYQADLGLIENTLESWTGRTSSPRFCAPRSLPRGGLWLSPCLARFA